MRRFFAQIFDAPAEIVIAHGRAVLAAFSLAAITIDPTEPERLAPLVAATLILYAAYAVALLGALHWRFVRNLRFWMVHSIDLLVVALLLFLTDGFSSPFLVFFTFALLAASLRWDWHGIALTIGVLVCIAGVVALVDSTDGQMLDIKQSVIRGAYLIATGTILAYASAHREHERNRLLTLARWPAVTPATTLADALGEVLKQAASVLEASRALAIWEDDTGAVNAAIWEADRCQIVEVSASGSGVIIPEEISRLAFSRTRPDLTSLNLANGSVRSFANLLEGELASKLQIADFSSSPFRGFAASGRLYLIGNIRPSDDHIPITSVVADRVGAELDRQIFLERATRDAALRERSVIMRDLHDGLLQSLTAARSHLELLTAEGDQARRQLATVRELLQIEQRRVREFVDASHATDNERVAIEMLRPLAEDTARLWGCAVTLNVDPPASLVSRKMLNELSLMLAEAVANAVRHGEADRVEVSASCRNGRLEIEIRDDGHGFAGAGTAQEAAELSEGRLPRSLSARIKEMGGRLQAYSSTSGAVLRLELSP